MTPDDGNNSNGNGSDRSGLDGLNSLAAGNGHTNGAGGGEHCSQTELGGRHLRTLFIAWFAANDAYWPHEKRLNARPRLIDATTWPLEKRTSGLAKISTPG
jgi:hypothetical protein